MFRRLGMGLGVGVFETKGAICLFSKDLLNTYSILFTAVSGYQKAATGKVNGNIQLIKS